YPSSAAPAAAWPRLSTRSFNASGSSNSPTTAQAAESPMPAVSAFRPPCRFRAAIASVSAASARRLPTAASAERAAEQPEATDCSPAVRGHSVTEEVSAAVAAAVDEAEAAAEGAGADAVDAAEPATGVTSQI